jgi:short-subunit dehydrogenase
MTKRALILGGTSGIARGTAAALARRGYALYLAGRDMDELGRVARDLRIRHGADVAFGIFDAEDLTGHAAFLERVVAESGEIDGVVMAVGYLGRQGDAEASSAEAEAVIRRNYMGPVSILHHCARYLAGRKGGFILGISSVAGDRGRQSNYDYGAAKGGLSLFLQGLRNRLHHSGVRVITIKPGFVDTSMTFGMPGTFLVASPDHAGERIARALDSSRDVVYVPWFWRYILLIIRAIPECLFKRLKL